MHQDVKQICSVSWNMITIFYCKLYQFKKTLLWRQITSSCKQLYIFADVFFPASLCLLCRMWNVPNSDIGSLPPLKQFLPSYTGRYLTATHNSHILSHFVMLYNISNCMLIANLTQKSSMNNKTITHILPNIYFFPHSKQYGEFEEIITICRIISQITFWWFFFNIKGVFSFQHNYLYRLC